MYKVYQNNNEEWVDSERPLFMVMGPMFFDEKTKMPRFDTVEIKEDGSLDHGWYSHEHVIGDMAENYSVVFFGTISECREYVVRGVELFHLLDKHKGFIKDIRKEQAKAVYRFIEHATPEELFSIILEIQTVHSGSGKGYLMVWNEKHKCLDEVESICMNGPGIQINVDTEEPS